MPSFFTQNTPNGVVKNYQQPRQHNGESPVFAYNANQGIVKTPNVQDGSIKYVWADAAERAAQTLMLDGELGVQRDTGGVYKYDETTSTWNLWFALTDGT